MILFIYYLTKYKIFYHDLPPNKLTTSLLLEKVNLSDLRLLKLKSLTTQMSYRTPNKNEMIGTYLESYFHANLSHKSGQLHWQYHQHLFKDRITIKRNAN